MMMSSLFAKSVKIYQELGTENRQSKNKLKSL